MKKPKLFQVEFPTMRKITKRHVLSILTIFGVYFLVIHLLNSNDYIDNQHKIKIIEESIRSIANQGQCKLPDLPVDTPEMMAFLKNEPQIQCGNPDDDWVVCETSICTIKNSVRKIKGKITCTFADILRKSDFKVYFGVSKTSTDVYILKESDFVRASCWTENSSERWTGVIFGIRENVENKIVDKTKLNLNVLMYGFDSLSKNAFIRKLPKSYKYITEQLKGDVLQGYNIVGDGTPQAIIPILTGFTELELPETRKRVKYSEYVNVYPAIWKEYDKNGYITSFNEDVPNIGTFSYRLNGFNEQPTDHYMRTYYIAIENFKNSYERLCSGHMPRHNVMLDYTRQFMIKYKNQPNFVFSFHGELSHDSINLIGVADDDIANWLETLKYSNILNNTVLIMMSDHGNRFAEVRNTLQGKQEERLPFFSFIFPEWFKLKYRLQYENFKKNTLKLTTPFDVHATLEDLLRIQSYNYVRKPNLHTRAISLFDKIPSNRSCSDAYIEPHWCACLNWQKINDTTRDDVIHSANALIDFINVYTEKDRNICAKLVLDEIMWAAKLKPQDTLVKFKQNKDVDGFLADLTSNTIISNEIYQIKVTLNPGKSIFEASIVHDIKNNEFNVKLTDISRVNKYGNQARCIYDTNPELRKYCYCTTD